MVEQIMPTIVQRTIADVLRRLPELVPWTPSIAQSDRVDLFICCAGFEDRSTAFVQDIGQSGSANQLVIKYPTNQDQNRDVGLDASTVMYDRGSFLADLKSALGRFSTCERPRIVIDLSSMASYVFYRLYSAIESVRPNARIGIVYAEAGRYAPSQEEWENFYNSVSPDTLAEAYEKSHFQSHGIGDTYESDVFPGRNPGPLPTLVVAIPSFSLHRMKSMLAYADSNYAVPAENIRWLLGQPPNRSVNGWRFHATADLYNVRNKAVPTSSLNYREVFQQLAGIWDETKSSHHIVIANLGSKMQQLGSLLFLVMHPECGLILSEPLEYESAHYSFGIGAKWWLDFGCLNELRQSLNSYGTLQFVW